MDDRKHAVVCGPPHSGASFLYLMMRKAMSGRFTFHDRETEWNETLGEYRKQVTTHPDDIFSLFNAHNLDSSIVPVICVRDPRSVMCVENADGYELDWNGGAADMKQFLDAVAGLKERVPDSHIVYYEDLISDPDREGMFLSCLIPFTPGALFSEWIYQEIPDSFMRRIDIKRPLDEACVDSWRRHPERIETLMNRHGGEIQEYLERFGYETRSEWYREFTERY